MRTFGHKHEHREALQQRAGILSCCKKFCTRSRVCAVAEASPQVGCDQSWQRTRANQVERELLPPLRRFVE